MERSAHFFDMGAVGANGLVQGVAGNAEFFGPIGDVGRHFGVDLFGVVGTFGVLFVKGMGFVWLRFVVVLGQGASSFRLQFVIRVTSS